MKKLDLRRARPGAVLLLVVLGLVTILGMLGLVIDGGNLYLVRAKAQTAADAAALAAVAVLHTTATMPLPLPPDLDTTLRTRMQDAADAIAPWNVRVGCSVSSAVNWPYRGDRSRVEVVNETAYQPLFLWAVGAQVVRVTNHAVARTVVGDSSRPARGIYSTAITLGSTPSVTSAGQAITIDSYDSRLGPYGNANRGDDATVVGTEWVVVNNAGVAGAQTRIGGSVTTRRYLQIGAGIAGTGSRVTGDVLSTSPLVAPVMAGNARIDGDLSSNAPGLLWLPALPLYPLAPASVGGRKIANAGAAHPTIPLAPIDFAAAASSNNNASIQSQFQLEDLVSLDPPRVNLFTPNQVLSLTGGTYYFEELVITGQNSRIDILSGPVYLYVRNAVTIAATCEINNTTRDPKQLQVFIGGENLLPSTWNSVTSFYGAIHAPRTSLTLAGNGDFYGTVLVGGLLTDLLSGNFHVDLGLGAREPETPYLVE